MALVYGKAHQLLNLRRIAWTPQNRELERVELLKDIARVKGMPLTDRAAIDMLGLDLRADALAQRRARWRSLDVPPFPEVLRVKDILAVGRAITRESTGCCDQEAENATHLERIQGMRETASLLERALRLLGDPGPPPNGSPDPIPKQDRKVEDSRVDTILQRWIALHSPDNVADVIEVIGDREIACVELSIAIALSKQSHMWDARRWSTSRAEQTLGRATLMERLSRRRLDDETIAAQLGTTGGALRASRSRLKKKAKSPLPDPTGSARLASLQRRLLLSHPGFIAVLRGEC